MTHAQRNSAELESVSLPEANPAKVRRRILVNGVVQGVGFRPYIYRLALEEHLTGSVFNDSSGVTIEVEGPVSAIEAFLRRLPMEAPPLAHISAIAASEMALIGDQNFRITLSDVRGRVATQIPADAATCDDCFREIFNPADRRYGYPFTNCTNCGPRFTITRRIPYDRPQTSMANYLMCVQCRAEYDDPSNRRFHAQPNACWNCGPRLWLTTPDGTAIATGDPIAETIQRLKDGQIVAIKGIGGFHLAVDATNEEAVRLLRERKRRHGKPFAVMLKNVSDAERYAVLGEAERDLLLRVERPIVLLKTRNPVRLAPSIAPRLPWLGVFLPYTPLHHLFFASGMIEALVMTSANLSDEPIAIDNLEAVTRLGLIADAFLMHDREILQRCDDSVVQLVEESPQLLRRARGFVPLPIPLPFNAPPLLAVGGHLKNTFCLALGREAYLSQHLGDLESPSGLEFFEQALDHLKRTFEIEPATIVHDLHPGYLSTQWAHRQSLPRIGVQHHHAHIAACMAEHNLSGSVIGIALDGTGYGADGHIWGGEVLIASYLSYERFGHLKYVAMPGSEAAIREPWRMAFSHLLAASGEQVFEPATLDLLGIKLQEARLLERMIARRLQSPLTSSCGRLFDAAAALILGRRRVDYEAQGAMELEGAAIDASPGIPYSVDILPGSQRWGTADEASKPWQLDPAPLFRKLLADVRRNERPAVMSHRFHRGVANAYCGLAIQARECTGIQQVCLSGGVLHNKLLAHLLRNTLLLKGFEVFLPTLVSPGDGGLSYGQAVIAAAQMASESKEAQDAKSLAP
ncbi:[NiFe] hydrogenase metallocenter assembly protein HypF [Acidisarcina polymorpha]|uniref:Carbamoyltransferase n=1 Tax=Acidisarcina polymorpha TaxID=2211140 RepID=A0A2Z5G8U3_9BACT|nr:carbamoyltransferase HypF [Acidisarcina polymorpha]AXC15114.1 [NiFe] hydrogenase metallocenter assembly protein HypF [Acidisarcina polymorpha]